MIIWFNLSLLISQQTFSFLLQEVHKLGINTKNFTTLFLSSKSLNSNHSVSFSVRRLINSCFGSQNLCWIELPFSSVQPSLYQLHIVFNDLNMILSPAIRVACRTVCSELKIDKMNSGYYFPYITSIPENNVHWVVENKCF